MPTLPPAELRRWTEVLREKAQSLITRSRQLQQLSADLLRETESARSSSQKLIRTSAVR
jgi:hypothetical protein